MNSYDKSAKSLKYGISAAATKYNKNNKQPKSFTASTSKKNAKQSFASVKQVVQPVVPKPQRVKSRENKVDDINKKSNKNTVSNKKNKQTESNKKGKGRPKHRENFKIPQTIKLNRGVRQVLPTAVKTKIKTFLA